MKKLLLVTIAALFLFQFACTKSVRYTEEEIKSFPADTYRKTSGRAVSISECPRSRFGTHGGLRIR